MEEENAVDRGGSLQSIGHMQSNLTMISEHEQDGYGLKCGVPSKQAALDTQLQSGSNGDPGAMLSNSKLEDQLTNEELMALQRIFEEADEDGGGGLDMGEFRFAMRQAMGDHLTDHELDLMFMKVDTNCDGTVDWDEYLSYMLLEYTEKDHMNLMTKDKPFPKHMDCVPNMNSYQRHHDTIVKVTYLPKMVKCGTLFTISEDPGTGRYLSITKEGIINFWSMELKHLRTAHINPHSKQSIWITDMAVLTNLNCVAIVSTAATLTIYEIQLHNFVKRFQVNDFEICATCLDYWVDPKDISHSILMMGDARGNIIALEFRDCPIVSAIHVAGKKKLGTGCTFRDIRKGLISGLVAYKLRHIHNDFVLFVKYLAPLECFVSCCRENKTALYMGDLKQKKCKSYFKVRKGIYCFDYCSRSNIIVTGGKDAIVRVWNPVVTSKPVMYMHGHKSAIVRLIIHSAMDQVISVSELKDIIVFDMSTQIIVQSIFQKWVRLGPRPISSAYFNTSKNALLLATNQLAIFEHKEEDLRSQLLTSHPKAINVVLYNYLFEKVVSGGADSLVCVWDIQTGDRIIQFLAHQAIKHGQTIVYEITAMNFDPTYRRLITAGRDGTVKIWNFNNGACLRVMSGDRQEITGVICLVQRIVTAGWSQRLNVYIDHAEDETVHYLKRKHTEDIFALACYHPSTVASGSFDGNILIWSMQTGFVTARFNPHLAAGPWHGRALDKGQSKATSTPSTDVLSSQSESQYSTVTSEMTTGSVSHPVPSGVNSLLTKDKSAQEAINTLIFFQSRENTKVTATLFSGNGRGWVRAWSIHADGGLRGQFNVAHHKGEAVTALATDPQNEILITADSEGYIKVWYVTDYCNGSPKMDGFLIDSDFRKAYFPFLTMDDRMRATIINQNKHERPPDTSCPDQTLKVPLLLSSYRAHIQGITSLAYVCGQQMIVSASGDCSVRLWKLTGEFMGIFGQSSHCWNIGKGVQRGQTQEHGRSHTPTEQGSKKVSRKETVEFRQIPPDIRRSGSATTIKVVNGGNRPFWKLARNVVMAWLPVANPFGQGYAKYRPSSEPEIVVQKPEDFKLPDISISTGSTSHILGMSFKSGRKHRAMPHLQKPRQFQAQYAVYSCLPFHAMDDGQINLNPPPTILEIQERNKAQSQLQALHDASRIDPRTGLELTSSTENLLNRRDDRRGRPIPKETAGKKRWGASRAMVASGRFKNARRTKFPEIQVDKRKGSTFGKN